MRFRFDLSHTRAERDAMIIVTREISLGYGQVLYDVCIEREYIFATARDYINISVRKYVIVSEIATGILRTRAYRMYSRKEARRTLRMRV